VLRIEIGVDVVAHSALHGPYAYEMLGDDSKRPDERFAISNARGFSVDVKRALTDEREDGTSLLTDMLDAAGRKAIEDGAEHWIDREDEPELHEAVRAAGKRKGAKR